MTNHPLMDRKQTAALLGISPATLDRMRQNPPQGFPKCVVLSERAIRWRRREVQDWMEGTAQ
ncbi:AlpA family phage regulatory protein [Enterobacter hormaechei]|uniref:helix-turn-helix transcriptional regulator n=1 Tax=Enterobacter hormaechei TaxID=158836 RepID=UPI00109C298D|nr:AlpA family phage regulatory protein [Enterobacter hormaechei]